MSKIFNILLYAILWYNKITEDNVSVQTNLCGTVQTYNLD